MSVLLIFRISDGSNKQSNGKSAGVEQFRMPGSVYSDSPRCPQVRSGEVQAVCRHRVAILECGERRERVRVISYLQSNPRKIM